MPAESPSLKYILAYDVDCGPCTRFSHIVDILDKYEKIDFIPLTEANEKGLLEKVPAPLRYKSFHLIFPDGDAKSGSDALLQLITILLGVKRIYPIINYLPVGKQVVGFIYKSVSRQHDTGSCSTNNNNNKMKCNMQ